MTALRALLLSVGLVMAGTAVAEEPVEANVGSGGGLVRLQSGAEVGLLAASAAEEPGWHRLHLEAADPQMPMHEAIGPRPIDRRSLAPLGPVEGPPVQLGPGLRIRLVEPDPTDDIGTGMIDAAEWPPWTISAPEDLMPYLPPEQAASRKGFLIRIPDAAADGSKERVSAWLFSPGGMRRSPDPRGGEDIVEAWDPCLKLGRLDGEGGAWFYLSELGCGLNEDPIWTPLREQSQQEFQAWVLEQSPPAEHKDLKRELRTMARDETKAEKDD